MPSDSPHMIAGETSPSSASGPAPTPDAHGKSTSQLEAAAKPVDGKAQDGAGQSPGGRRRHHMNGALTRSDIRKRTALVLAGGVAMGAFESGVYAAFDGAGLSESLEWVAGSSIGAVTAAIIAGNRPEDRVARQRQFWHTAASDPAPVASFWFGPPRNGFWRQAYNQASVLETLVLGRSGLFRPRLHPGRRAGVNDVSALYDLAPLQAHLTSLVDFDLLNRGDVRVTIAATDIVTGERVVFDTAQGCVITPEHVLASCALLPLFAPIELDGRLLGDGGLSSNAPLDIVLSDPSAQGMRCFVVDLFAQDGSRPHTLAASASRAGDLAFGNQSRRLLEGQAREGRLRKLISQLGSLLPPELCSQPEIAAILSEGRPEPAEIVYISYRAGLDEAGLGKPFDFSSATIADRWEAGKNQMQAELQTLALSLNEERRPETGHRSPEEISAADLQ
jgi:NTE family protein